VPGEPARAESVCALVQAFFTAIVSRIYHSQIAFLERAEDAEVVSCIRAFKDATITQTVSKEPLWH
jgi:hypothetical protein